MSTRCAFNIIPSNLETESQEDTNDSPKNNTGIHFSSKHKYRDTFGDVHMQHWQIQGALPVHALPPPNRINFFHFHIRFCQKVYTLEVGTPPTGQCPPMGNPGSATVQYHDFDNGDAFIYKDKYTALLQQELQSPYWCLHDSITNKSYQISTDMDIETMPHAMYFSGNTHTVTKIIYVPYQTIQYNDKGMFPAFD